MRRRLTLSFLAVSSGAALYLVGCGGDDSSTSPPVGSDGGDATAVDAAPDGSSDTGIDTGSDAGSDATDGSLATDATHAGDGALDAPSDGPRTLDGALCSGGAFTVGKVDPQYAWTGGKTAITITGTGFTATPKVYLRLPGADGGASTLVALSHAAFVSTTSISAVVPSGIAPGTYDVEVVNPDTCAEALAGSLRIVANAPPKILSVAPSTGTTQTDVNVVVTGCHFPANTQLTTLDATAVSIAQTANAPACSGANDARCDNTPLCTIGGTILTATKAMAPGAYVVRATNPTDNTFGDYASFVVTNPSGKLTGNWSASSSLSVGRRSHASVAGRIDDASRFLYALGGESATGAPLDSVEVAPLDRYGQTGKWSVQKNRMKAGRSGLSVVRQGQYLWAIGGTSTANGTGGNTPAGAPLASIERAKILDTTTAPVATDPPATSTSSGTLAQGTWYYKVAAVMGSGDADNPSGETLASDEVVANLTGNGTVTLTWAAVTGADHYRVYRSPAANGTSQSETLLKDSVTATTFADDGSLTIGIEAPMAVGATGVWIAETTALAHARLNAAAVIAPQPSGALHVYVLGGWGACTGVTAAEMSCWESTTITADGSAIGAVFVPDVAHPLAHARQRHGAATMTAANGPPNFVATAGAATAFVLLSGGHGISSTGNTTEYAVVDATGSLGTFAATTGYANERDGSQLSILNGYAYSFLGGTVGNYRATSDLSTNPTLTPTTLSFGNWSNAGSNLGSNVGRFGLAQESAYFYVIGGTSNDTDAMQAVYQIIY